MGAVEPIQRTLEVFQLQGQQWRTVGTWEGNVKVRAVPFDAMRHPLATPPGQTRTEHGIAERRPNSGLPPKRQERRAQPRR